MTTISTSLLKHSIIGTPKIFVYELAEVPASWDNPESWPFEGLFKVGEELYAVGFNNVQYISVW